MFGALNANYRVTGWISGTTSNMYHSKAKNNQGKVCQFDSLLHRQWQPTHPKWVTCSIRDQNGKLIILE